MKRLLVVIFLFVYIGTSTGVTLNIHRCMGKLVNVELWQNDKCSSCGAEKSKQAHSCCTTEMQQIKLTVDQSVAQLPVIKHIPIVIALLFDVSDLFTLYENRQAALFVSGYHFKTPPECSGTERLIQNCTFLI